MNFRLPRAFLTMCMSVAALTACGSSDDPESTPSASASQSGADAESDEGRYNAALKRFTEYENQMPTYYRDPKRTAAAEKFLREYWVDPTYQLKVLDAFDKGGIKSRGAIKVLKSQQQEVASTQVRFRQCVDYTSFIVTEKGKRLPDDQKAPQWRYVTMQRQSASLPWKIDELDENTSKDRPCDAS